MANLLKPDAQLVALEDKLAAAKTQKEADAIRLEIDARQTALREELGTQTIAFGSKGYYLPGNVAAGTESLEPTAVPGVYSKSVIGTDTSVDPFGRQSLEKTNDPAAIGRPNYDPNATNKKVFYDENGNQLTPEQVVKSGVGASFAAAGWDIGFGKGNIGAGTPATKNLPFSGSASTVNLPFSGSASTVKLSTAEQIAADAAKAQTQGERKSAYDLLYAQFKQYGLESLVEPLKELITSNTPPSEFIIKLRDTDAYKKRFAGNAARIAKGLAAINEAEYIGLEDQYQNIMRNYGLPASYWSKDSMGTQAGFTNFIGNDVSATELEDRIMTAQKRVINSNPQVTDALKKFYPEITNGDILAYTLDPTQGLDVIKRKITAAEIGGAALTQGLQTGVTRAEELAKYGVTKEQAMQGYQTAAEVLPRGGQLAAIYGESPYTQQTAEQEIFGLAGSTEAAKQRKKLVGLERASFSGQTGLTQGALGRERAGNL